MKKNAQTATAVIAISAILLLTVTAETAILSSGIWTREKYTLAFLALAAGIALVYPLLKTFEEKTLKKGYDKASEEISLLEKQADELNRALKISEHNLKTLNGAGIQAQKRGARKLPQFLPLFGTAGIYGIQCYPHRSHAG